MDPRTFPRKVGTRDLHTRESRMKCPSPLLPSRVSVQGRLFTGSPFLLSFRATVAPATTDTSAAPLT